MRLQLLTIAAPVVCLISAFAQNTSPPGVIQITREVIKEGRATAHEKTDIDFPRALRKAKFPYHVVALNSMSGQNEVWFIFGYPSWADAEKGGQEFDKQPLKSDFEAQDARDGEHRATARTMWAVYRKDMSYHPDRANLAKTRNINIVSFRVRLGHIEDFTAGSKVFLGAQEKANFQSPTLAYEVVAGAPAGLFLFLEPMESIKSLDEAPARNRALVEAMGADNFRQLLKGEGDVFVSIESDLFAVNPLFSYVSKEVEDADPDFWRPKAPAKPAAESKPKEKTGQ
jgi:hypothetical protein